MVDSITPIEGEEKRRLVDRAEATEEFETFVEHLEERGFQIEEETAAQVVYDSGETRVIVSFLMTNDRMDALAEIVATIDEDSIEDVTAGIDHYERGEIVDSEELRIEEGQVRSQTSSSGSALTRPSSSATGTACQLCQILYRTARQIVQSNTKTPGNLTTSYLRQCARSTIRNQLGASVYQNHSSAEAQRVINHVQNNGVSQRPQPACRSIGSCP